MLLHEIKEGGYGKLGDTWYLWPPGMDRALPLVGGFSVDEHDDGTITVSPSVGYGRRGDSEPNNPKYRWHGFLKRGVWSKVA